MYGGRDRSTTEEVRWERRRWGGFEEAGKAERGVGSMPEGGCARGGGGGCSLVAS